MDSPDPILSIIIINRNTRRLLLDCIASAKRTIRRTSCELIVVDNASTDGSVESVSREHSEVRVIANQRNTGFAAANNMAMHVMRGRYALLLNSDTILLDEAVDRMVDFMEAHPQAGMCGPQLLNGDRTYQTSIGTFPTIPGEFVSRTILRFFAPDAHRMPNRSAAAGSRGPVIVDFIIGACMLARKRALDDAGMLDEAYFFYYEEIDWCFRIRQAGWHVYHLPGISIIHLGGQSTKDINLRTRVESWRSRYIFFIKSRRLPPAESAGLYLLGFAVVTMHFLTHTIMNALVLFSLKRMRRRWLIFAYLFLWHLVGCPRSMGLPR